MDSVNESPTTNSPLAPAAFEVLTSSGRGISVAVTSLDLEPNRRRIVTERRNHE